MKALHQAPMPHSRTVDIVFNQQSAIGWDQFLRGRVTHTWTTVQNQLSNQTNGQKVIVKVINYIFQTMYDTWIRRNKAVHDNNIATDKLQFRTFVLPKIQYLYSKKHLLPAHDQLIFDCDLESRIQQPKTTVNHWLQTNEKYLLQALQRENTRIANGNQRITRFFPVVRSRQVLPQSYSRTTSTRATTPLNQGTDTFNVLESQSESQNQAATRTKPSLPNLNNDLRPP
jgi:hypothetical protein